MKIVLECKTINCGDNILYITSDTTFKEIRTWLRIHDLKRVIRFLPDEYDTIELPI